MSVRRRQATPLLLHMLLVLAAPLLGCSSHTTSDAPSTQEHFPDECRDYFAAYSACMHSLSPQHPDTATARVDAARASLALIVDEAALKQTCTAGTAQLRSSCR